MERRKKLSDTGIELARRLRMLRSLRATWTDLLDTVSAFHGRVLRNGKLISKRELGYDVSRIRIVIKGSEMGRLLEIG